MFVTSEGNPYARFKRALNTGNDALVDRFVNDLKTLYGYTIPGDPKGEFTKATNNDKYFARGDFNVAKGHQLTVRHNYIDGFNDISSTGLTTSRSSGSARRR